MTIRINDGPTSSATDVAHVLDLAEVMIGSRALHVAAEIGVADLIGDTARSVDDLAKETETNPQVLSTMLRLLAGHGIFTETETGQFALTSRGELLRADHPLSLRSYVRHFGFAFKTVQEMEYSLRHGLPSFDHVVGQSFFEFMHSHPERGAIFDAAMADLSRTEGNAIVSAYDFSGYRRIVDVGGGNATFLAEVLASYPESTGVLFDQSHVTPLAEQLRDETGLGDRLEVVAGDFFDKIVDDGDLYLLKTVIHDWPDDRAADILRVCRTAMPAHGKLVLFERMLLPGDELSQTKNLDLLIFLLVAGRERTQQDFEELFANSGFRIGEIKRVHSTIFAVEGIPV
jgi:hypothetical protein